MTVWRFLFISLALHLIIWTFFLKNAELNKTKDQSIEVSIVNKSPDESRNSKAHQIVRAPPVPDKLLAIKKHEPKFLGEKDQSVVEQTRSHMVGLTQNGGPTAAQKKNNSHNISTAKKNERELEKNRDGTFAPKKLTDLGQTLFSQQSMNSDAPNNVKEGLVNALDTERFTYYSFFSRVDEKIYPLAQRYFDETVERMNSTEIHRLSLQSRTTVVDVLLTPRGDYVETVIQQSSGNAALDNVAVDAFRDGKFFPNPPIEMVKKDGKIHLQFGFNFVINESAFARRSSR
jgi:TonB family protein